MNKLLAFLCALLVPAFAYATTPGTPLVSILVPSGSTVPAPAGLAGFTTHVLHEDFTTWADLSSHIVECGASGSVNNWHWTKGISGVSLPCNSSFLNLVSDSPYSQVLKATFPTTQWDGSTGDENLTIGVLSWPKIAWSACVTGLTCPPLEFYVEMRWRTDSSSWNQNGTRDGTTGWWNPMRGYNPNGTTLSGSWLEPDFAENLGNSSANPQWGAGLVDWGSGSFCAAGCSSTEWNTDFTSYHTQGVLVTSDESTAVWKCTYIDGTGVGCNSLTSSQLTDPTNELKQRDGQIANDIGKDHNLTVAPTNDVSMWIVSVDVWACSGWATGGCAGTMVTSQ